MFTKRWTCACFQRGKHVHVSAHVNGEVDMFAVQEHTKHRGISLTLSENSKFVYAIFVFVFLVELCSYLSFLLIAAEPTIEGWNQNHPHCAAAQPQYVGIEQR